MSVFKTYAQYYDLLYQDKNYREEADFVGGLFDKHAPGTRSILDAGCGTGAHAFQLAKKGYRITGIDQSEAMISSARQSLADAHSDIAPQVSFHRADIQNLDLSKRFHGAVSLFHVINYQISNGSLNEFFRAVRRHLEPGGVFIFDFWYGPAVLTDKPAVRIKRLKNVEIEIIRIAEPVMNPNDNTVDVHFTLQILQNSSRTLETIHETHKMRYLFIPEIRMFLSENGFQECEWGQWLTGNSPGFDSWSAYCVARATP